MHGPDRPRLVASPLSIDGVRPVRSPGRILSLATLVVVLIAPAVRRHAHAGSCAVPSGPHPTIQAALDDPDCDPITLAAQSFAESIEVGRSVAVVGAGAASTSIEGRVLVLGSGTVATLHGATIVNGCPDPGMQILAPAQLSTTEVAIEPGAVACPPLQPIFMDGFESGDTSAWGGVVGKVAPLATDHVVGSTRSDRERQSEGGTR